MTGVRLSRARLALLALAAALGSLATQMFVPALPAAAVDLHSDAATMQLAISLYLLGLGCGQLIFGPVADSAGRKPVLLGGILLFVLGSLFAALSGRVWQLLAARVAQALGGAATLLGARATVADSLGPDRTAGGIAALMTATLLSPMIGPTAGGILVGAAGWRSIFWLLAALGGVAALLIWRLLGESLTGPRIAFSLRGIFASYTRLTANRRYMRCVLANACVVSSLYVFMSGSPFLLIDLLGFSPEQAGLFYVVIAGATIFGTLCVGRLERSGHGLRFGTGLCAFGGALMLALDLAGAPAPVALLVGMLFIGAGAGITTPAAMARAIHHAPEIAGTAASFAAAFQMLASALTTSLVAALHIDRPLPLAAAIFATAALAVIIAPPRSR